MLGTGLDEYYTYDNLNRLTEMQRGTLNSGKTGIYVLVRTVVRNVAKR